MSTFFRKLLESAETEKAKEWFRNNHTINNLKDLKKAIDLWSYLPLSLQEREAKNIIKVSKKLEYNLKHSSILSYSEDINIINKLKDKWKKENVTFRGIKQLGNTNEVYGSFGKGLYTAPNSNKAMAKQYGELYYVVNAIPKNPKIVSNLNEAEILRQKLINDFCKKNNESYSPSFFEKHTSMDKEMLKLGFDGLVIKGREMVNYEPKNIKYFKTEDELYKYYESLNRK